MQKRFKGVSINRLCLMALLPVQDQSLFLKESKGSIKRESKGPDSFDIVNLMRHPRQEALWVSG